MSLVITEMQYGKRIQADGEVEIVEKEKWERLNAIMADLKRQLDGMADLIRNAHKYGLVRDDKSLDFEKFAIYDSVNKARSIEDTKARVYETDPNRDERSIAVEYNRYTVQRGVEAGWDPQKIHEYLKSKGSTTQIEQVKKYADQFKIGKGMK